MSANEATCYWNSKKRYHTHCQRVNLSKVSNYFFVYKYCGNVFYYAAARHCIIVPTRFFVPICELHSCREATSCARSSARRNNRLIPSNLIELASRTWPLRSINSAISNRTFIFLVHNYRRPSVPNITDCSVSRIITSSGRRGEDGWENLFAYRNVILGERRAGIGNEIRL